MGKTTLIHIIKQDEDFFRELVVAVSKNVVFSWEFLDNIYRGANGGYRPFSEG